MSSLFKNKKGVELGLNTIVIAAIVLIVLVVVVYIIGNAVLNWNKNTAQCDTQLGECVSSGSCDTKDVVDADCPDSQECCRNNCIVAGGLIQDKECDEGKTVPLIKVGEGKYCCKT